MDNAVALVQAYLRINGYFTVSEYPVVAQRRGGYRTATDLDILAFRFPHAGRLVPAPERPGSLDENHMVIDAALDAPTDRVDMIVGEVKEGRAVLNEAALDAGVLRAVLVAFGCCSAAEAPQVIEELMRDGRASLAAGHDIRMVVFASITETDTRATYRTIGLRHVVEHLRAFVRDHWDVLRHWDSKDPAFGMLVTLAKAEQGSP